MSESLKKLKLSQLSEIQYITVLAIAIAIILLSFLLIRYDLDQREESTEKTTEAFAISQSVRLIEERLKFIENNIDSPVYDTFSQLKSDFLDHKKLVINDLNQLKVLFSNVISDTAIVSFEKSILDKLEFSQQVLNGYNDNGRLYAKSMLTDIKSDSLNRAVNKNVTVLLKQYGEHLNVHTEQRQSKIEKLKFWGGIITAILLLIELGSILYFVNLARKRRELLEQNYIQKEEIKSSLDTIKDLFDHSPIGYHSTDKDGLILSMNAQELKWLGFEEKEVVGVKNIEELIPETYISYANDLFDNVLKIGEVSGIKAFLKRKDGTVMEVLGSSTAHYDEGGNFIYNRTAIMDYSERSQLENKLQLAMEEAEKASMLKDQFMANMSHEIRTPLNAIVGFSSLLNKTSLQKDQKEFVQNIVASSENLITIVNDILDFSKIEAGALRIEKLPFSIKDQALAVENMFDYKAREKKLKFTVVVDEGLPKTVLGDPLRLSQVLINLVNNSFKFTESGEIDLRLYGIERNENLFLTIEVEDSGVGIPEDKLETIFDRFGQASSDITRKFGGTGLGLSIVKQLVDLQNGSVRVQNKAKGGVIFTVEMPYPILEYTSKGLFVDKDVEVKKQFLGKVLVVEDNQWNRRIMELMLDAFQISTTFVENGELALEKLNKETFDLIFMDLQMPIMDGYTATEMIRNKLMLSTPIVATTAHVLFGEKEKCIKSGMNAYLAKPIKESELEAIISNFLNRIKRKTEFDNFEFNDHALMDICKGDKLLFAEMVDIYTQQINMEIANMIVHLQNRDFQNLKSYAHSMRGTIGYMGYRGVAMHDLEKVESESQEDHPDLEKLNTLIDKVNKWVHDSIEHLVQIKANLEIQ